jgi:peptidoglycan/xylan/chitin deacetylase (PgdA/CDA1 family)
MTDPLLRRLLLPLLLLLLTLPGTAWAGDYATAFVYHRFGDSRYPSTNTSLADFRAHLETLRRGNYSVLTLGDVVSRLRANQPLPERCVVLTVDDAFRSFLSGAVPLLREFGYPATLFVNTGEVGGQDFLSWAELRQLAAAGIEIGNHSAAHGYLLDRQRGEDAATWRSRVRAEIQQAQDDLRKHLGITARLFAYPYGEFSGELMDIVRELGFSGAVGQQSGPLGRGQNMLALPRFPAGGSYGTLTEFRDRLRFRPLPVQLLEPGDAPLIGSNPPEWRVRVAPALIDPRTVRCYVTGQGPATVRLVDAAQGEYLIKATSPLTERRGKYTLTGTDRAGQWYWYSQLWVRPR